MGTYYVLNMVPDASILHVWPHLILTTCELVLVHCPHLYKRIIAMRTITCKERATVIYFLRLLIKFIILEVGFIVPMLQMRKLRPKVTQLSGRGKNNTFVFLTLKLVSRVLEASLLLPPGPLSVVASLLHLGRMFCGSSSAWL